VRSWTRWSTGPWCRFLETSWNRWKTKEIAYVNVSRRALTAAATALCLTCLTACGSASPGVAARVGDDRISAQKVDDFAEALCALGQQPGGGGGTPAKASRQLALQILLSDALAEKVTDVDAADRAAVEAVVQQLSAGRASVPDDVKDTFDEVVQEYSRAQNALVALGRRSLQEAGQKGQITDNDAFAEGQRLQAAYAKKADIEVDPRFGTIVDGVFKPGDGSLSVPVSDLAVQGDAKQPDAGFIAQLPAAQKCS
jgi:hypothetical protein